MLGIEENPVETGIGHDFRGDVAAQGTPEPNLRPGCGESVLEGISRQFHGAGGSDELHRDGTEWAEIAMHRVAFACPDHAREGAREHGVPRLQRHAVRAELVREPGDAHGGVAEHARGESSLLDLAIDVHDASDPAQIDVERPYRSATEHYRRRGTVVRDRVEYLPGVHHPCID